MKIPFNDIVFEVKRNKNKKNIRRKAKKAIDNLYKTATNSKDKSIKKECYQQLWNIKLKYNLDLKKEVKISFCRKCKSSEVKTRTKNNRLIKTCKDCGYIRRYPLD